MLNNIVSALAIAASLSATTYAFSPSQSSNEDALNQRLHDEVNDIMSIMNQHIGSDLQIPIYPDLMASFFHSDQEAGHQYLEYGSISTLGSEGCSAARSHKSHGCSGLRTMRGIDTGSKMMMRLCVFDLMRKVCSSTQNQE